MSGAGVIACSPSSAHTDSHIPNAYKYRSHRHALACLFWWVNLMRGHSVIMWGSNPISSILFLFPPPSCVFLRSHKLMSACELYRRRCARVFVFADAFLNMSPCAKGVFAANGCVCGLARGHCVGLRVVHKMPFKWRAGECCKAAISVKIWFHVLSVPSASANFHN